MLWRNVVLTGAALLVAGMAYAATPVGAWTQIDRAEHPPESSVVKISQLPDGTLEGVVQRVIASRHGTDPVCAVPTGARHGKPMVGVVVIWGVSRRGDKWEGGQVLDPLNGKSYKVRLSLADHGQELKVRAYAGVPLFGRTQVWMHHPG